MKKSLLLFCLFLFGIESFAQKSYVNIAVLYLTDIYQEICISGDIPGDMKSKYSRNDHLTIGEVLNKLSAYGFEVEFVSSGNGYASIYLLSKNVGNSSNSIQKVYNDDEEAREVARYNLQGMPVREYDKGIQIIVYSNYTTKTVIVQ